MRKFYTLVALVVSAVAAVAQVPALMNYSCSIKGSDGAALADANVSMRVALTIEYTKYEETHSVTTDANGLANIVIGKGTATAQSEVSSLAELPWIAQSGDHKLKVEIDPDGGTNYTISGESEIGSVPYAFCSNYANMAGSASKVGDMPTAFVQVKVEGADVEFEFLGRKLTAADGFVYVSLPAYSPVYYSVNAHGKYYTIELNGVQLKNEKMTYKKPEGVVVNALSIGNYNDALDEMGIATAAGFSGNTMVAGRPMFYTKGNNSLFVSESVSDVPSDATGSYTPSVTRIPVNGFSYREVEVDRGELIGKTDVKNRLVGPFNENGMNTIVIKQSATVPPLY